MVRFNCPGCRVVLKAPDRHIGAAMPCPNCGRRLFVPGPMPADAPASRPPPLPRSPARTPPAGAPAHRRPASRLPVVLGVGVVAVLAVVVCFGMMALPAWRGDNRAGPIQASADKPPPNDPKSSFSKSAGSDPPPASPTSELAEDRRYALIVGVQNYTGTGLGNLRFCDNDAAGLYDVLTKLGYHVTLMTRPEWKAKDRDDLLPTAQNIRNQLRAMLSTRKPTDTVLLAFSGHGIQLRPDGKKEGKMYFCAAQCDLDKAETLIALDEVYALLKDNPAGGKVLIADCCRNDPLPGRQVMDLDSVTRPELPEPPASTVALFSCAKGQVAYESPERQHGYLFHFVIEGMKGEAANKKDGRITWLGVAKYVDDELPDAVRTEMGPKFVQTPEVRGESLGLTLARVAAVGARTDAAAEDRHEKPEPPEPPVTQTKPPPVTQKKPPPVKEEELRDDIVNSIDMKLKLIKPGKFLMGSPMGEDGRYNNEGPQHVAEITKPFYMGVYPVTRSQFAAFVMDGHYQTDAERAKNPFTWLDPGFAPYNPTDDDPVVEVTWNDAVQFCRWLGNKEKKIYELPTEAEWEYACRAGTTTAFSFGDDPKQLGDYAWYSPSSGGNSGGYTHPVGQKTPNPWGLYDMHGNVCQWCADSYRDPNGRTVRPVRGGSWFFDPRRCRSAYRLLTDPAPFVSFVGLRVVLRCGNGTPRWANAN